MVTRKQGTVKKFIADKNIGWIESHAGGEDVFFHKSVIKGQDVNEGDRVEYVDVPGDKGPKATYVLVLSKAAEQSANPSTSGPDWEICFFDTFYNEDGQYRDEIFYDAPTAAARILSDTRPKLTPTAYRAVYQGFLKFAGPLRDGRMKFAEARAHFGTFFVERIVRQHKREVIPRQLMDLFEKHKELALSSKDEMLGLFKYVTNILCFFGDKDK